MRRIRVLTVLSAAAVLAALVTPGSASAADTPSHGRLLTTVTPSPYRQATPRPAAAPGPSAPTCTPTPAGSRERRLGGVLFCVGGTVPATRDGSGPVPAQDGSGPVPARGSAAPMESTLCASTPVGAITYARFGSCRKLNLPGTLFDQDHVVLGTFTFTVVHNVTLRPTSSIFDDQITVTLSSVTGKVSTVFLGVGATCTSACQTTKATPWAARPFTRGQSATGTVSFAESLVKGAQDATRIQYNATASLPDAIPAKPNANWDGVRNIRCDNAVGGNPGCVYPNYVPDLVLSLGEFGAAAVTYYWAQAALPDGWGMISPLHRLADDKAASANRARTCDSTFVPLSAVANDSCDEFPFAKSYEGGGAAATCADILPLLEGGTWHLYEANPDKPITELERCVRGHVPLSQNEAAGGELGRFTQAQRLLDFDSYYMYIVD